MLAFLDAVIVWAREVRRDKEDQSDFMLDVADQQMRRELAHLNETLRVPSSNDVRDALPRRGSRHPDVL